MTSLANKAAVVASVFAVLYVISYNNDTPAERMAHIRSSDIEWVAMSNASRGRMTESEKILFDGYARIVNIVDESRKSVLGLFPSYRAEKLYEARRQLTRSIAGFPGVRLPHPEALLLLAKLNFLLGDVAKSIPALRDAGLQDGPAAEEARKFLSLFDPKNS